MKIKVLSEGSLSNMFLLISTVMEKVSPGVLKKKNISLEVPKKRILREERTSMI